MGMIHLVAIAIFLAAFAIALGLSPALARRARRRGVMDRPGGRKTQETPVPYGGGPAVFLGVTVPLLLGLGAVLLEHLRPGVLPRAIAVHMPGVLAKAKEIAAILFAATLMAWMGRRDDRRPMPVWPRFLLQLLAGGLIAASGLRATVFTDMVLLHWVITIFWVVLVMNAANFIDNMDGLMAGVLFASTAGFTFIAGASGQLFVAAFGLAIAGALAGFFVHNRAPASIYAGDEGSMFIGTLVAALALALSFRGKGGFEEPPFVVFLAPAGALFLPLADAATAIIGRLMRGVSPFTAGRDHLSHRLCERGFTPRGATRFLIGVSFAANAAVLLFYVRHRSCGLGAAALAAVAIAFFAGAKRAPAAAAEKSADIG